MKLHLVIAYFGQRYHGWQHQPGQATVQGAIEQAAVRVFKEPVDQEHLTRFYADPARYAFNFQIHLLHKRIGIQMLAACEALYSDAYAGAIVDRSLFGDEVFASLHHDAGNIDDLDWEAYRSALRNMQFMIWPPTTLIYLRVQPEVALARMQKRMSEEQRAFEGGVTLEYLQELYKRYETLVKDASRGAFPWSHTLEVRYVDWNPSIRTKAEWDQVAAGLKE